jgi:predicted enzyme involved in methoxymalonyl-ACP biosynthesis
VNFVVAELAADGAVMLIGEYIPTEKNAVVANLYDQLGFEREGDEWVFDLTQAPTAIPDWFELHATNSLATTAE